jgi:N-acetylglucosaminyldiphosphoundecaprenol N-acetyl-beta-D-mannosaminyltransferase
MYFRYGEPDWESAEGDGAGSNGNGASAGAHGMAHRLTGAPPHRASRRSGGSPFPTVDLRGVRVHAVTEADCVCHIISELDAGRGGMVVTPNLDHLHRCLHDLAFAATVSEAELVVADGMPLVWAARLQGTPLPERVAGSNLISSLSDAAAAQGRTVFFLGGAPTTADGAAKVLCDRFPSLKVVGTACPPVGFENDPAAMADLIQTVSGARPDVVFVALGSPKQERLIVRLRPLLPQTWWLGVGISFSFLCGDVRRAPVWMQKTGLEWVHRLLQEPRRLFHRYVVVGIPFAGSLLGKALLVGLPSRLRPGRGATIQTRSDNGHAGGNGQANGAGDGKPHQSAVDFPRRGVPSLLPEVLPASALPPLRTFDAASPVSAASAPRANGTPLHRLRALVLLGGSVRPTDLGSATCRSVLDLPLDENGSILTGWLDQAAELARSVGIEKLPVRVMVNHTSIEPASADARHYGAFRVERDRSEYRGTGGVLRDVANDYADDDLIVVANAAQVLLDPLPSIVAALDRAGGDVTVVAHQDGTPSGIMLVACKTLRQIASSGYVDMKEQALPQIAAQFDVRVVTRQRPTGMPIRTLEDYIHALRFHHRRKNGKQSAPAGSANGNGNGHANGNGNGHGNGVVDPLAEDWSPLFSLIEPGATVDPSARIHDSVVLEGGVVEAGAVLVRSVVCPGGVLRKDKTAMEVFVTSDDARHKPGRNGKRRDRKKALPASRAGAVAAPVGATAR